MMKNSTLRDDDTALASRALIPRLRGSAVACKKKRGCKPVMKISRRIDRKTGRKVVVVKENGMVSYVVPRALKGVLKTHVNAPAADAAKLQIRSLENDNIVRFIQLSGSDQSVVRLRAPSASQNVICFFAEKGFPTNTPVTVTVKDDDGLVDAIELLVLTKAQASDYMDLDEFLEMKEKDKRTAAAAAATAAAAVSVAAQPAAPAPACPAALVVAPPNPPSPLAAAVPLAPVSAPAPVSPAASAVASPAAPSPPAAARPVAPRSAPAPASPAALAATMPAAPSPAAAAAPAVLLPIGEFGGKLDALLGLGEGAPAAPIPAMIDQRDGGFNGLPMILPGLPASDDEAGAEEHAPFALEGDGWTLLEQLFAALGYDPSGLPLALAALPAIGLAGSPSPAPPPVVDPVLQLFIESLLLEADELIKDEASFSGAP
eukprot:tig00020713_g13408.t1